MTQTKTKPSAIGQFFQKKEGELASTGLMLCGVLSVVGFASAATLQWVEGLTAENYYIEMYKATDQLHAAAPASPFTTINIVFIALVAICLLFCAHAALVKRKK